MGLISKYVVIFSNLTFGQGGKDKDGVVKEGWGYYEVREVFPGNKAVPVFLRFVFLAYPRRLQEVQERGRVGMELQACTFTSPTRGSETSRSWSGGIRC